MLNKFRVTFIILFTLVFFQLNATGENNKNIFTKVYDNGTIYVNLKEKIDSNLKEYIKSGIPFNCTINIELKKYSKLFFIKDKLLKKYEKHFKFSYDIIKKKYIIVTGGNYFATGDYKEFLKKISIFKIDNILNKELFNKHKYYCNLSIFYTPIKGSFSVKDIYIFPKIKKFSYEEKLKLEE